MSQNNSPSQSQNKASEQGQPDVGGSTGQNTPKQNISGEKSGGQSDQSKSQQSNQKTAQGNKTGTESNSNTDKSDIRNAS